MAGEPSGRSSEKKNLSSLIRSGPNVLRGKCENCSPDMRKVHECFGPISISNPSGGMFS
jgi:hypothetical protein